jgi:hypothetical protein
MRSKLLMSVVVGLVVGGCAAEPVTATTVEALIVGCDVTRCGTNSPVVDTLGFHELNLKGLPNAEGLRLLQFVQNGITYTLHVERGKLSGTSDVGMIAGNKLVGAQLIIENYTRRRFALIINAVGIASPWTLRTGLDGTGLVLEELETYDLQWTRLDSWQPQAFCQLSMQSKAIDSSEPETMSPGAAVLFEGDRIDRVHMTIDPKVDLDWFNIGCAGSALAKLALSGHTQASSGPHDGTTWKEAQTLLKMMAGDYCGNGWIFTIQGQPLYWQNETGTMNFPADVRPSIEARWSSQGAICLGQPRLDVNAPETWPDQFSRPVTKDILRVCPELPTCTDDDPYYQDNAYLVSANPLQAER